MIQLPVWRTREALSASKNQIKEKLILAKGPRSFFFQKIVLVLQQKMLGWSLALTHADQGNVMATKHFCLCVWKIRHWSFDKNTILINFQSSSNENRNLMPEKEIHVQIKDHISTEHRSKIWDWIFIFMWNFSRIFFSAATLTNFVNFLPIFYFFYYFLPFSLRTKYHLINILPKP